MKEPTMTEFERAAEKYAKRWAKSLGADFLPASLVDEIAEALASHARPAAGFIREATGPDRKLFDVIEEDVTRWMQMNYALCCEVARLEHELVLAVKSGHKLSTTRGPYAAELLSKDRPATPAAAQAERGEG